MKRVKLKSDRNIRQYTLPKENLSIPVFIVLQLAEYFLTKG